MKFFALASRVFLAVSALVAAAFLSSCTVAENGQIIFGPVPAEKPEPKEPNAQSKYYSSVHYIWVDEKNLDTLTQANSRVEVDLGDQRARVYRTGKGGDKLIIETQISTGKEGHNTPSGSYRFLEKTIDKHSNLYGKWVDADSGDTVISDGDIRKPPSSRKCRFSGRADALLVSHHARWRRDAHWLRAELPGLARMHSRPQAGPAPDLQ